MSAARIGDTACGTGEMVAWMIEEKAIEPHVPLWEKGERDDGTFSRSDFVFDTDSNTFTCTRGTRLQQQYLASWQSYLAPGATGCMRKFVKTRSFRRPIAPKAGNPTASPHQTATTHSSAKGFFNRIRHEWSFIPTTKAKSNRISPSVHQIRLPSMRLAGIESSDWQEPSTLT